MSDSQYLLLFNGEIGSGFRRREVLDQLTHLTNCDTDSLIDQLFAIKPLIIKRSSDSAFLEHFRQPLAAAGLLIELIQETEKNDEIAEIDFVFAHYAPIETASPQLSQPIIIHAPTERVMRTEQIGRYALLFAGALSPGMSQQQVISNLARLCNCSEQQVVEEVFSVIPLLLASADERTQLENELDEYQRAGLELTLIKTDGCDESLPLASLSIRQDRPETTVQSSKSLLFPALVGAFCLSTTLLWLQGTLTQQPAPAAPARPSPHLDILLNQPQEQPVVPPAVTEIPPAVTETVKAPVTIPAPPPPAPVARAKRAAPSPVAAVATKQAVAQNPNPVSANSIDIAKLTEAYDNSVRLWLANHQSKSMPLNAASSGRVTLAVELDRAGRLLTGSLTESSGHAELDALALADLKAASPFPAMPMELAETRHRLTIRILYRTEAR